jgi:hypothetical protein
MRWVGPVDPRPGHLTAQHRDLVAQHQQLGIPCLAAERIASSASHRST